jgi:hypothetical protein
MKIKLYVSIIFSLLFCNYALAANLCLKSEKNIFSFETKAKKILSICKGDNNSYLTYRFGTIDKTELQFPQKLDASSWKEFEFSGMRRGGGKQNAGFGDYSLLFEVGNIGYTIFQEWDNEEDTYSIGVIVSGKGKPVTINGRKETQEGSLVLLEGEAEYLPNSAER